MNFIKNLFNRDIYKTRFELIEDRGNGFYSWNGTIYKSDIVRACIRPKVKAVGKLIPQHIRNNNVEGFKVNPEVYIRFLYEEPNPYMSGQVFREKMATQLALNNNAFALLVRDENGYPIEMYNIPCTAVEAIYNSIGELFLKFTNRNGKVVTYPYKDIIHIRQDINENDIFGDSPREVLLPLMEVVSTTDQGIVKAIRNSGMVKWLLKFNSAMRPEDVTKKTNEFTENFLNIENSGGAAGVDSKVDAKQIEPKDYVPNAAVIDRTTQRIYSFFNTNEKIVQSKYNEDEWNSYYESEIEPLAMQWSNEDTRKIFTRRERGFGNKIIYSANNLQYASMTTKLGLVAMVDRSAMTPNEWREVLNLPPIEDGDKPLRRLDTMQVNEIKESIYNKLIETLKGGE
ncbi:phage portal protein [Veillonella sp.]|uniref:phage portal protein n=1 Tax=Veillonella sp. TaxID=1926307 RepID=UPI002060AA81|nr:phage portal protein [Veillonella sp.]MBS6486360.1 phage portal protein [Veillonella sp.]DAL52981.1 MAG TPA_asm: portal protein [Caudoviricetes sp.]